jgi:hypothetical protein
MTDAASETLANAEPIELPLRATTEAVIGRFTAIAIAADGDTEVCSHRRSASHLL